LLLSLSYLLARHKNSNQTYMVCTYVHTYVHMYIHFKIRFSIGETAINRRRGQLKGFFLENKLALTIGESLEWSKSKFKLICSFPNFTILLNKSTYFFEICIFSTWYLFYSKFIYIYIFIYSTRPRVFFTIFFTGFRRKKTRKLTSQLVWRQERLEVASASEASAGSSEPASAEASGTEFFP
jgi:hypothetical protein